MLLRRVAGTIAGGLRMLMSGLGPARAVPMMFQDNVAMFGNVGGPPTMVELINSANNLACHFTMNCVRNRSIGTPIGDFILGKQDFIDSVANNSTLFAAQISEPWNNLTDPFHMAAKPKYVTAGKKPTAAFLFNQLRMGEDLEIVVKGPLANHYLTVTGINYNPMTGTGTLNVIDPGTGKPTRTPLTLLLERGGRRRNPLTGFLLTNYAAGAVILDAVVESPKNRGKTNMPEPGGLMVLAAGLAGVAAVRPPSLGRLARRVGPLRFPLQ